MQFTISVVTALASLAAAGNVYRQDGSSCSNSTEVTSVENAPVTASTTHVPTTVTVETQVPETTVYYTCAAPASDVACVPHSTPSGTNTFLGPPVATNVTNSTSTTAPPVVTGAAAVISPMGAATGAIVIIAGVFGAL